MQKPNIIFYFSDQQRYDTINEELTPNLWNLAKEGILYENTYTCQPVCGPARACLQTGVYATENGCHINGISLPNDKKTLAEIFNDNGYQTAYIGKWHLASDSIKLGGVKCEKTPIPKDRLGGYKYFRGSDVLEFTSHGYDGYVFDEEGKKLEFKGYRADCINDYALEYIKKYDKDSPFFMFISQLEPHHQNDRHCFEGYKPTVDQFKGYPIPEDLKFLKGNYEKEYPDYLSAINRLDYNVGKLIETLKAEGLYENTVILYTSDHGCHFKTRNMEYKRSCHNSCAKIPLIISGCEFKGGKNESRIVSLIDMPSTILDIADIQIPPYFRGITLKNYLTDITFKRDYAFMQISESQVGRAIVTERYTYSIRAFSKNPLKKSAKYYQEDYLYDNKLDPCQKNNLVSSLKYKDIRIGLKKLLVGEMIRIKENSPKILNNVIKRKV